MSDETPPPDEKPPFLVGYARVSRGDQNNTRQVEALKAAGCDERDIWQDTASGKNMRRPGWEGLWRDIREGDVVVVLSVDRLGRDVLQILQTIERMKERGVGLRVLQGGMDTSTASGRFAFNVMAGMAQFERELIVERTIHGLAAAKARKVAMGRPEKITAAVIQDAIASLAKRESLKSIAERHGVHPNSLSKRIEKYKQTERAKGKEI